MTFLLPSFAFLFSAIAYYYFNKSAHRFGLLDVPNTRSSHTKPTIRGFGVVIFLSVILATLLFDQSFLSANALLFVSVFIVMLMGLMDDVRGSTPLIKISALMFASVILFTDGYLISSIGVYLGVNIELYYVISVFFTLLAIVAFTNAFNLIDGLDGLAASISIVILSSFLYIGYLNNDQLLTTIPILFIATTVVFLMFNWYPAKVFMGDSGSLMLGFVISILGIYALNYIEPISILFIAAFPIFDSLIVFLRRVSNGGSPFAPDRTHLHHILLGQFDGNVPKTVAAIVAIQIVFSAIGLLLVAQVEDGFISLAVFVALLFFLYKVSSHAHLFQTKEQLLEEVVR